MGRRKTRVDVRIIPVDSINEPKMLVREEMGSREELLELGESMRENGQIQPIVVAEAGDRFDLVVGHRRLHAAKLVKKVDIEAKVIKADLVTMSLMRYKENNERLSNSPYEEAVFIKEMLENIGCSQIELSKMLGKSAAYVTQRLAILDGYECVREALRYRHISFAQARELLLMPTEKDAKTYLAICVKGGANSNMIRQWRNDLSSAFKRVEGEEKTDEERDAERDAIRLQFRRCEACGSVTEPVDLVYLKMCKICAQSFSSEIKKYRRE